MNSRILVRSSTMSGGRLKSIAILIFLRSAAPHCARLELLAASLRTAFARPNPYQSWKRVRILSRVEAVARAPERESEQAVRRAAREPEIQRRGAQIAHAPDQHAHCDRAAVER